MRAGEISRSTPKPSSSGMWMPRKSRSVFRAYQLDGLLVSTIVAGRMQPALKQLTRFLTENVVLRIRGLIRISGSAQMQALGHGQRIRSSQACATA
jgi:hypothetical protein